MLPSKTLVKKILKRKKWQYVNRPCRRTGSSYLFCSQGYKRVVIRFSDHAPSAVRWRFKGKIPAISFHPGSDNTLADLCFVLDGYPENG